MLWLYVLLLCFVLSVVVLFSKTCGNCADVFGCLFCLNYV